MTNTQTKRKIYGYTDYATAIRWLGNNYNEFSVATKYDPELKAIFKEKYNNGYTTPYISDCSEDEVQYLKDIFGLIFEYSKVFQKWLLIVDHFGTRWEAVKCPVYSQIWWSMQKKFHSFNKPEEYIEEGKKYYTHFEIIGHIYKDIKANSLDEAYEEARNTLFDDLGELENTETTVVSITEPNKDNPIYFD